MGASMPHSLEDLHGIALVYLFEIFPVRFDWKTKLF
jgi:hypothetical protein